MMKKMESSKTYTEDLYFILKDSNIDFNFFRNCSIFISGATGLIGSTLIKTFLLANQKFDLNLIIYGLARDEQKVKMVYGDINDRAFKIIYGDVTSPYEVYLPPNTLINYIFHTANVTSSKNMITYPVHTILTAIEGTNQILRMAVNKNIQGMVYTSSMEMYGNFEKESADGNNCTEECLGYIDPLKVRSNYPESKRMCENLCIAYISEFNIPVKIARLSQTFGAGILPWENRVFAQFAKSVLSGRDIVLHTHGKSEGNYCYLRDTIRGLLTILIKGNIAEAYNIVNEQAHTSIAEMAQMVCHRIAHGDIRVVYEIADNLGYATDTTLNLKGKKLESLGWRPSVGLEEMYRRTISYLKELQ